VKIFFLLVLVSAFGSRLVLAQDVEVTFYSGGSQWADASPATNSGAFTGYLFDGRELLTGIGAHRFVTLRLPAGPHVFSASLNGTHPANNSALPMTLVEGQRYFIRALLEIRGVAPLVFSKGHLDEVSCDVAHHDADKAKPVEYKHVAKSWRGKMVDGSSLPACP
jgi:hypothetical protein